MIFIYCLVFFFFFLIDSKYERGGNNEKNIWIERSCSRKYWIFKWLVMKVEKKKRNHRMDRKYYKNFLYVILLWKSWVLHTYSRNYVRRCRDKFSTVFEIWNRKFDRRSEEIRNKSKFNSNDLSKAMLE